jgi:hypothetical protein
VPPRISQRSIRAPTSRRLSRQKSPLLLVNGVHQRLLPGDELLLLLRNGVRDGMLPRYQLRQSGHHLVHPFTRELVKAGVVRSSTPLAIGMEWLSVRNNLKHFEVFWEPVFSFHVCVAQFFIYFFDCDSDHPSRFDLDIALDLRVYIAHDGNQPACGGRQKRSLKIGSQASRRQ